MKKLLLLAVIVLTAASVNAQVPDKDNIIYVKAGTNISKLKVDDAGISTDSYVGYNFGFAIDHKIGQQGFFLNTGLQVASKGGKTGDEDMTAKLTVGKIEIPVSIGFKLPANNNVAVEAFAGGYAHYDAWGKFKVSDEEYGGSIDLKDIEDYDRFGAGIQFGAGVWYDRFNLSFTYQVGLTEHSGTKDRIFGISLGYAF
ncbi:MAG: porin family protein [Candidatus Egerieousia sp.]